MPLVANRFLSAGVPPAMALFVAFGLVGCAPQPTYQVVQAPAARVGTVESVQEQVEQVQPGGAWLIIGGFAGGGLGTLVGAGTGPRSLPSSERWEVPTSAINSASDTTTAPGRRSAPTGLKVGDRVKVTDTGIELLH